MTYQIFASPPGFRNGYRGSCLGASTAQMIAAEIAPAGRKMLLMGNQQLDVKLRAFAEAMR